MRSYNPNMLQIMNSAEKNLNVQNTLMWLFSGYAYKATIYYIDDSLYIYTTYIIYVQTTWNEWTMSLFGGHLPLTFHLSHWIIT